MRHLLPSLMVLALAACTTVPASGPTAPSAARGIPTTPIELGDRHAPQEAVMQQFEQTVTARYATGLALTEVSADLRGNEFNCAANADTGERGDPPAQICRKTVTAEG